jgi:hypothetical protein
MSMIRKMLVYGHVGRGVSTISSKTSIYTASLPSTRSILNESDDPASLKDCNMVEELHLHVQALVLRAAEILTFTSMNEELEACCSLLVGV